ncbi:FAD-dependent oxidoreductase [Pseudonocardia kujensis]|uniref:NAD(P)/FAD-dependent oxidoreductase n=1 Tax=Pseudonocardia kujensis TaxID=1128675 RepID=UPI001E39B1D8|nr:FAD-dependent oxidoreductase [Pseudonocardia kujensis]MCE0766919.1 FAD-dependent oxidoreductase [Pseudonocardia kujensis]
MHAELLVVGGGPAALAAATSYRDHGGDGAVVLVSDDTAPPYFRPPLSKDYLRGESEAGDTELTPATTYTDRGITLLLRQMVTTLSGEERAAQLSSGDRITFKACVLATGSAPKPLPVPGADAPAVAMLRSLDSAKELRSAALVARTAVVVGSGFIGCEAAASLARRGLDVTVVSTEELPQENRLGADAGRRIAGWLADDGVRLVGGAEVEAIEPLGDPEERPRRVRVAGHEPLEADLVLVAGGIDPRVTLARATGAKVEQDRVVVDEHMRTSLPGLYAAGDVAYARNATAGRHLVVEHWGEAEAMGTVAGGVAAGADLRWDGVPGFWTEIGGRTLKYAAWGDGYETAHLVDHGGGAFTVWYADEQGRAVGVATHEADEDYERGQELVAGGKSVPDVATLTEK